MRRQKVNQENKKQMKILNRVTDKAIKIVQMERRGKNINYFNEWYRYIGLVHKGLKKYLN